MNRLEGKIALVTGSGRGLGRACAKLFAREGARVVVADINPEGAAETVQLVKEMGGEAIAVTADISKPADVRAMVQAAVDAYGGLDCAVNNAVLSLSRVPLADIAEEDWDRALAVNLTGVFVCMKYEIRAMLERGGGSIVNIGSGNEHSSKPGLSWYLGAKQAIYAMTKIAALEYAGRGVRVNAVGPGSMWTPGLRAEWAKNPNHVDQLKALTPLNRLTEPEEVAETVIWLCTAAAGYVVGHTLLAEGGATLG